MSLKPAPTSGHDGGMKAIMKLEDLRTIDQLSEFLSGTQVVATVEALDTGQPGGRHSPGYRRSKRLF